MSVNLIFRDSSASPNSALFGLHEIKIPINIKILYLLTIFFNLCTTRKYKHVSLSLHLHPQMKLFKLFFINRRRCINHNIAAGVIFWESNKVADDFLSAQNGNKSIQTKSNSAVRWRAVLERIH